MQMEQGRVIERFNWSFEPDSSELWNTTYRLDNHATPWNTWIQYIIEITDSLPSNRQERLDVQFAIVKLYVDIAALVVLSPSSLCFGT